MLPKKQAALAPRWGGWAVGERRQPKETLGRLRRALQGRRLGGWGWKGVRREEMQRKCEWASDPRHWALAKATWWRWGEGRMGFHAPLAPIPLSLS